SMSVNFVRFNVGQTITGLSESVKKSDVLRIRLDEQIAQPCTHNLTRVVVAVHSCHRVVAFSEIRGFKEHFDLLAVGRRDRDRPFEFKSPYRFRTVRYERTVTLIALLQTPCCPGTFDRFPTPVGNGCYELDLFDRPMARRLLMDGHSRLEISALVQRDA